MTTAPRLLASSTGDPDARGALVRDGVAYVLDGFPVPSERFIEREVGALRALGVRLPLCLLNGHAVHSDDEGFARALVAFCGCEPGSKLARILPEVARLAPSDPRGMLGTLRWLGVAARHAAWLRRRPPALVHAHFGYAPAVVARFLAYLLDRPWGVSVHAHDIYVDSAGVAARIHDASYIVACSQRAAEDVQAMTGAGSRVHAVHHGLDIADWSASPRSAPSTPHVLAAGRFVPKKGFDTLVRACARLQTSIPAFRCTLVGEGPERAALQSLIAELCAPVTLVPWCSPRELRSLYQTVTALVAPCQVALDGDRDNIPNVIVEAMAARLPVIATRLPSLQTLFADHDSCLLVEPGSVDALAEAMRRVSTDPVRWRAMSRAGRQFAELHFDQSRNILGLVQVFCDSISDRGSPIDRTPRRVSLGATARAV